MMRTLICATLFLFLVDGITGFGVRSTRVLTPLRTSASSPSFFSLRLSDIPITEVPEQVEAAVPESSTGSETESEQEEEKKKLSVFGKFRKWFAGERDDGLTSRQRLAKMGLAALLSYGFVSNMSYAVSVSCAWFIFTKQTGISPLAKGQWKPFLAVYAGFYVFNNIVRPIRFGVAMGVTPYFERTVKWMQDKTGVSKAMAIGFVVFLANIVGTISAMSFGISFASALSGVPVFPPKV